MGKKTIQEHFEKVYLRGSCFKSLKELMQDRTIVQTNVVRASAKIYLRGIWRGLNDEFMRG